MAQNPVSIFDIFMAIPEGIISAADMVVCTLIIGGGVGVAYEGSMMGFIAGPTNQSNVGIPQSIAGLPLYSGIGLRCVLMAVLLVIGLDHVLRYAKKVKADPEYSRMKDIDVRDLSYDIGELSRETFTWRNKLIILVLIGGMVFFTYEALAADWWLNELSAVFIIIAVLTGIIGKLGLNDTCNSFLQGISEMSAGAIIIGIASAIRIILEKGTIMDSIVNSISTPLSGLPMLAAALGMLAVVALFNLIMPSGSAKAVAMMPILLPIGTLLGITQQTMILVYQFGDGITNFIAPASGLIFLATAFGRVPYDRWCKFCLPLMLKIAAVAVMAVAFATITGYGPF